MSGSVFESGNLEFRSGSIPAPQPPEREALQPPPSSMMPLSGESRRVADALHAITNK
jgi:hypothetical protein